MAARTRKGTKELGWPEQVRERIKSSMLVNRLSDHVLGTVELTSTQVAAALGLLRKTMPDLAAVAHSGTVNVKRASELNDDELAHIASDSSDGASTPQIDPAQLN